MRNHSERPIAIKMAAAFFESLEEEEDNLVTCGVCSCEYDANQRKPKFLPCAHTVCVLCLKVSQHAFISVSASFKTRNQLT